MKLFLSLGALLICLPTSAWSQASPFIGVVGLAGTYNGGVLEYNDLDYLGTAAPSLISDASVYSIGVPGESLVETFSSEADADGTLHAKASVVTEGTYYTGGPFSVCIATAYFADTLTFGGHTGTGFFSIDDLLEGSYAGNGECNVYLEFQTLPGQSNNGVFNKYLSGAGPNEFASEVLSDPIAFSYDSPITFEIAFSVTAYSLTPQGSPDAGSETVDFSHTSVISGLNVYDQNGNLESGVTVSSQAGNDYKVNETPAPASAFVFVLGGAFSRRRRAPAHKPSTGRSGLHRAVV